MRNWILIDAIKTKSEEYAISFFEKGHSIETEDNDGSTALMVAAAWGHQEIVKYLLDHGANVNAVNEKGKTALMNAVRVGYQEIVKLLLDDDANIDAVDQDGSTALKIALDELYNSRYPLSPEKKLTISEIVKLLIDHGANTDNIDNISDLELTEVLFGRACSFGAALVMEKNEIIEFYLNKGVDDDGYKIKDSDKIHKLVIFAGKGMQETVKLFLKYGADINRSTRGANGETALMAAAKEGQQEMVEYLLDHGANVNAGNKKGKTALMVAEAYGHQEIVNLLLDNRTNVDALNEDEETTLSFADKNGQQGTVEPPLDTGAEDNMNYKDINNYPHISRFVSIPNILQKFLDNGMDINISDENDNSLLVAAVNADNIESIKFLLRNKADINYKNFDGKTPLSFARSDEVKELLTNKGAVDSKCNYCSKEYSSYDSHKKGIDGFCSQDCSFKADEPMREKMRLEQEAKLAEEQRKHNEQLAAKEAREEKKRANIIAREERIRQVKERERQENERWEQEREKREENWQIAREERQREERQRQERERQQEEKRRNEKQCQWCGKTYHKDDGYYFYGNTKNWCSEKCYHDARIRGDY